MNSQAGFLGLARIIVPRSLADAANDYLRKAGRDGYEGFALWAGRQDGSVFHVTETVVPAQGGIRSEIGVGVAVDGEELFRLNVHLYERGLVLVAQLHSHPGEAFHSDTDDAFPIATTAGALSLVVPNFAVEAFSLDRCAVYRLLPGRAWVELSQPDVRRLIHVVRDDP